LRLALPDRRGYNESMAKKKTKTEKYLNTAEAAQRLGVSRCRILQLVVNGRFSGVRRVGTSYLIPARAVSSHRRLPIGRPRKDARKRRA
jgi:excisionase family DNA binding protein